MPVFTIVGTKGGTGKSTFAMGLVIWISKLRPNDRCILIDGDMHVRSSELKMCPVHDVTLKDVLAGNNPWTEAVYTCELESEGNLLYPKLAVMPAGGRFLPPLRGSPAAYLDNVKKIFDQMITAMRKKFKYIVIDTPASFSLEHLILTAAADATVYICEPNDDSINSTVATSTGLKNFLLVQALGVILSRVPREADVKKWLTKARQIAPVLGVIPEDPKVGRAFRENLPVAAAYPDSPSSLAMRDITQKILKAKVKLPGLLEGVAAKIDLGVEGVLKQLRKEAKK
jgi:MinD-like ATPase involved in chromosome partitioning or flagellar assembly